MTTSQQWQVTCQCGWRTHGPRDTVVAAVQEHGRQAHQRELSVCSGGLRCRGA